MRLREQTRLLFLAVYVSRGPKECVLLNLPQDLLPRQVIQGVLMFTHSQPRIQPFCPKKRSLTFPELVCLS